jgi:hypothetical protein
MGERDRCRPCELPAAEGKAAWQQVAASAGAWYDELRGGSGKCKMRPGSKALKTKKNKYFNDPDLKNNANKFSRNKK